MLLWLRGDGRPWAVEPVSDLHTQPPIGYSLLWDDSFFHQKTIAAMVHTVWCGIVELWNVMELMTRAIQQSWWYQQFIPLWETREENQQLLQFTHSSSVRFRSIPTGPFQTFSRCVSGNKCSCLIFIREYYQIKIIQVVLKQLLIVKLQIQCIF